MSKNYKQQQFPPADIIVRSKYQPILVFIYNIIYYLYITKCSFAMCKNKIKNYFPIFLTFFGIARWRRRGAFIVQNRINASNFLVYCI